MAEPLTGSLKLRQRSNWEAADSGILLWRNNFAFFTVLMIAPFIAAAVLIRISPLPAWSSYLLIWWLKPLFARPVLHVISVRFFKPQATFRGILKGFAKSLFIALPGDLLWRRFSLWRSARMPVRTLEHLSGNAARMRIKTLELGGLGFCSSLTILTSAIFFSVFIGELFFAIAIIEMIEVVPLSALWQWQYVKIIELLIFCAICLNFILIEPLYVCMGFGIYINSRIEVEGWDIQLLLQNFIKQKKQKTASRIVQSPAILKVIVFISIGLFFMLSPCQTIPAEQAYIENSDSVPIDVLNQILSSPDFGGQQEGWGIRLRNQKEATKQPELNFDWLAKIKDFFGMVLFLILILLIIAAVGYIALRLYRLKKNSINKKGKNWKSSFLTRSGGTIISDPNTLLSEALLLHNQGMIRDAWAKCFLAAIAIYSTQDDLEFPVDATEYDCLSIVKKTKARNIEGFGALVLSWTGLAYGGKMPDNGIFEKAVEFCNSLNQAAAPGASNA